MLFSTPNLPGFQSLTLTPVIRIGGFRSSLLASHYLFLLPETGNMAEASETTPVVNKNKRHRKDKRTFRPAPPATPSH